MKKKQRITRGAGGLVDTEERGVASSTEGFKWPYQVASESFSAEGQSTFNFESLLSAGSTTFIAVVSATTMVAAADVTVTNTETSEPLLTRIVGDDQFPFASLTLETNPVNLVSYQAVSWALVYFEAEDDNFQVTVNVPTTDRVSVMLVSYQNVYGLDYDYDHDEDPEAYWSVRLTKDKGWPGERGAIESNVVSTTKEDCLHVYGVAVLTNGNQGFGPGSGSEVTTSMLPGIIWSEGLVGTGDSPQYSAFEFLTDSQFDSEVIVLRWAMWLHPTPGSPWPPGEQGCCMDEPEQATTEDLLTPTSMTFINFDNEGELELGAHLYTVTGNDIQVIPFADGNVPPFWQELPDPHQQVTVWQGNINFFDPEEGEFFDTHLWVANWVDSDDTDLYRLVSNIQTGEALVQKLNALNTLSAGFPFDEEWPVSGYEVVEQSGNVQGIEQFLLWNSTMYTIHDGAMKTLPMDDFSGATLAEFNTVIEEIELPHDYFAVTVDNSIWVAGMKDEQLLAVTKYNSGGRLVETHDVRVKVSAEATGRPLINGMVAQGLNVVIGTGAT